MATRSQRQPVEVDAVIGLRLAYQLKSSFERTAAASRESPCTAGSAGLGADNAVCQREHHQFGPGVEPQLLHDVRSMGVHRPH